MNTQQKPEIQDNYRIYQPVVWLLTETTERTMPARCQIQRPTPFQCPFDIQKLVTHYKVLLNSNDSYNLCQHVTKVSNRSYVLKCFIENSRIKIFVSCVKVYGTFSNILSQKCDPNDHPITWVQLQQMKKQRHREVK